MYFLQFYLVLKYLELVLTHSFYLKNSNVRL